jgi:hypothetical protein
MAYISMIRDGTWLIPYTSCNYSYRVGLVETEGKYPSSTRVGLLSSYLARISM